jgi:hypothetical protein
MMTTQTRNTLWIAVVAAVVIAVVLLIYSAETAAVAPTD